MVKLLIVSVTWHMPQNRVSGTIAHVTLSTIINVLLLALGIGEVIHRFKQNASTSLFQTILGDP
jgi:hypothetical protein